jgi:hypothetical protein
MAAKGIGYNPLLTNTYQTNNQNNNWYDNITSSRYNNYNNYDGAQEYDADYGKSFAGIGRFDPRNFMRPSNLTQDMGASNYQAPPPENVNRPLLDTYQRSPHEGFEEMEFDETVQQPKKKNFLRRILDNTIIGKIGEKFKRSEAKQAEIDAFNQTGMFGNYEGKMWDDQSGLGKISLRDPVTGAVLVRNKNVDSMFGSDTIEEMAEKKNAWIKNRILKNKPISKVLQEYAKNQGFYSKPEGDQVTTGGRWGTTDTSGWDSPGYTTRGGFTGKKDTTSGEVRGHHGGPDKQGGNWGNAPGTKGGWGPGAKDGGRIGYQDGELVGQETDFIQGPQGGEEFQETVVEGEEQPSREQLEALAMEIFQLPLEELDDEQLLVVYQEAMQGQPMEEAVQEEDVQFAANGGRMGYLFGGDIEQQTDFLEGPQEDLMASDTMMESSEDLYRKAIQEGTFDGTFEEFLEELDRMRNKFTSVEGGLASIL